MKKIAAIVAGLALVAPVPAEDVRPAAGKAKVSPAEGAAQQPGAIRALKKGGKAPKAAPRPEALPFDDGSKAKK